MMKTAIVASLIASAAAFAPAQNGARPSVAVQESQVCTTASLTVVRGRNDAGNVQIPANNSHSVFIYIRLISRLWLES